ncbi:hypothetical protein QQZ08_004087 [Neonectria magnoliae]|uniref:histidine kinase n=1 Tax=Neonectria magnoliae TaxID=2732573 RepID=A0ABR1I8F3_9HYPO
MGRVTPYKSVSEGVRERETFKYDSSLLHTARFNNSGGPLPAAELFSSADTVLTALAQLGACQTGADRALICLFDADCQYIVAEATPSQPLRPSLSSLDCPVPLWLCGTAIPRSHGACELALLAGIEAVAQKGHAPADLPLTISQDLTADARFASRPQCQPGSAARFYAAVPIRTRRGINIGVYCVINSTPGKAWTDEYTNRLRGVSKTIMHHLQSQRSEDLLHRHERMTRGLGSFIEGKATIAGLRPSTDRISSQESVDQEGILNAKQQLLQLEDDLEDKLALADSSAEQVPSEDDADGMHTTTSTAEDAIPETDDGSPTAIFSKAANIIRESIEMEGCFFFDATMGSYRSPTLNRRASEMVGQSSPTSSSDESVDPEPAKVSWPRCQLLGYSTSDASSVDGASQIRPGSVVAEKFLTKLLRRYPKGRIFNFGADGELQSSDSSEEDRTLSPPPLAAPGQFPSLTSAASFMSRAQRLKIKRPWARQREGSVLLEAFPGARSVAFVPIWDPRKERWYAGGFIYTNTPTRIFSLHGELSYLRAFGMLAMAEVLRANASLEDKAKSDALGSLSHELRSPLHGVLLNAELLIDTHLDVFQGNAVHTIETCSRTLLDTIDHLLDYSKINSFATKKSSSKTRAASPAPGADWKHFGQKSLFCNSRLDGLVEEVIESVFSGFNFQHLSIEKLSSRRSRSETSEGRAAYHLDALQAREQLDPRLTSGGELQLHFGEVSIFLSIDPHCNWTYYVQVGAFRRIIMNLFGNALKYTHRGSIKVTLTQETLSLKQQKKQRVVKFAVQDTGKGMSTDYLRQGLFKPFSQEDNLAPGTGLGLSLVKQITSQLGGQISVSSQVGVGTTVSVAMPLDQVPQSLETAPTLSEDDREFEERVRDLKGLRIGIKCSDDKKEAGPDSFRAKLEDVCLEWLHMEVILDAQGKVFTPDLILWSQDALPKGLKELETLGNHPNIVVCSNPLEAYRQSQSVEAAGYSGIFEFISQPTGPRKLAKTLLLAYRRWMGLPKSPTPSASGPLLVQRPAGPNRHPSSYTVSDVGATTLIPVPSTREAEAAAGVETTMGTEENATKTDQNAAKTDQNMTETERNTTRTGPITTTESNGIPTAPASTKETSPGRNTSDECTPEPGPPSQFLLVDDNHINLKVLSAYMNKLGLQYQIAMNGQEALDRYLESPRAYACVLMDISMPVMDGFEATRCIRAYECQSGLDPVSIIALSGLASEEAQREAFGSGMNLFLTKPVKLKALGGLLRSKNLLQC